MPKTLVVGVSRAGAVNAAVVALLYPLDLIVSWSTMRHGDDAMWPVPAYAAAAYLALLVRRRYPVAVLSFVVVHSTVAALVFPAYIPALSVWLAVFTVAERCELSTALLGFAAAGVPTAFNIADSVGRQPPGHKTEALVGLSVLMLLLNGVVFVIGRWTRWSVRQRRLEAERAAADAAAAERSRIARDLHDVVAHAVTMMLLQAGGAARFVTTDPPRAAAALERVDALGHQAIVELHRMLDLMRPGSDQEVQSSLPGLDMLGELAARSGSDDLRVEVTTTGTPRELEPGVDLSAYRIVQEALTNATRYAERRSTVHITLTWHADSLEIAVVNRCSSGRAASALSTGNGLIGMRERARTVDGELTAGLVGDGMFAVRAKLPLPSMIVSGVRVDA